MTVNRKYVWTGGALAAILLIFLWRGGDPGLEPVGVKPDSVSEKRNQPSWKPRHEHEEECAGCPEIALNQDGKLSGPVVDEMDLIRECREFLEEAAAAGNPAPDTSHLNGCEGETPLHHARTAEQIQLLLDNGSDPNSQDTYGATPLHLQMVMATLIGSEDGVAIVQKLLEAGADPWITDRHGKLPLEVAQMQIGLRPQRLLERIGEYMEQAGFSRSESEKNPEFREIMSRFENLDTTSSTAISELMKGMIKTAPPWIDVPDSVQERM